MKAVFADTFYFLAYLNGADLSHSKAVAASQQYHGRIVSTVWVLTEVADAFATSTSRSRLPAYFASLEQDEGVKIIPPSQELFRRALRLYGERADKDWPLTDCVSFVAMADEGITEALTGDHHFEQAGLTALLK